ncbi:hypothetical protein EVAR_8458_1 [Eumeta japonica]|uniref:Uncharacterized protein n=1 Tax=Eumeta variegata TaxID=151549 RepID=A0A4C1WEJ5_EUMVA|nr:hypothetical protein EVAR_8458_1 [Eumeta japonica]
MVPTPCLEFGFRTGPRLEMRMLPKSERIMKKELKRNTEPRSRSCWKMKALHIKGEVECKNDSESAVSQDTATSDITSDEMQMQTGNAKVKAFSMSKRAYESPGSRWSTPPMDIHNHTGVINASPVSNVGTEYLMKGEWVYGEGLGWWSQPSELSLTGRKAKADAVNSLITLFLRVARPSRGAGAWGGRRRGAGGLASLGGAGTRVVTAGAQPPPQLDRDSALYFFIYEIKMKTFAERPDEWRPASSRPTPLAARRPPRRLLFKRGGASTRPNPFRARPRPSAAARYCPHLITTPRTREGFPLNIS